MRKYRAHIEQNQANIIFLDQKMCLETPKAPGLASKAREGATFVEIDHLLKLSWPKLGKNESQKHPKVEQISLQGPKGPLKDPSKNGDAFQPLYAALREGEVRSVHV